MCLAVALPLNYIVGPVLVFLRVIWYLNLLTNWLQLQLCLLNYCWFTWFVPPPCLILIWNMAVYFGLYVLINFQRCLSAREQSVLMALRESNIKPGVVWKSPGQQTVFFWTGLLQFWSSATSQPEMCFEDELWARQCSSGRLQLSADPGSPQRRRVSIQSAILPPHPSFHVPFS